MRSAPPRCGLGLTYKRDDNTLYGRSRPASGLNHYNCAQPGSRRHWSRAALGRIHERWTRFTVSTSGASKTGVKYGDRRGRIYIIEGAADTRSDNRADSARNLATNSLAVSGHSAASTGRRDGLGRGPMVRSRFRQIRDGHTRSRSIIRGSSADDDLVQSGAGPFVSRSEDGTTNAIEAIGRAFDRSWVVRRHRCDLPALAIEHAALLRRRTGVRSISCSAFLTRADPSP